MPMSFPDMQSLKDRATQRKFRQPEENETEEDFRKAFAEYMRGVDFLESQEILISRSYDEWNCFEQSLAVVNFVTQNNIQLPKAY